jgi:hypothetical protein
VTCSTAGTIEPPYSAPADSQKQYVSAAFRKWVNRANCVSDMKASEVHTVVSAEVQAGSGLRLEICKWHRSSWIASSRRAVALMPLQFKPMDARASVSAWRKPHNH